MGPTIPTPPASSTVTNSSVSNLNVPLRILQITLISAQDLAPVAKAMRTYALAWVQPDLKLSTRVDHRGRTNPTWDDKFAFRVDDDYLGSETAAVTIEIYNASWFRHVLVGTVRVLVNNLISPSFRSQKHSSGTRYVALQIRRPSGSPQGILNMGVSLLDPTAKNQPLYSDLSTSVVGARDFADKKGGNENNDHEKKQMNSKIQFWRSLSSGMELNQEDSPPKNGSICNGSAVNGSELSSDVGPSASIVAAEIAKGSKPPVPAASKGLLPRGSKEVGGGEENSILEDLTVEEAMDKGLTTSIERWREQLPSELDGDWEKAAGNSGHSRRHSDGGLFSCFGNAYGFEFTIVCGASNNAGKPNAGKTSKRSRRKKGSSKANSA